MNFDQLEKTWSRQTVSGQPGYARGMQTLLVAEVRQRSNSIYRVILVGGFVLGVGWTVTLAAHFAGIRPLNAITLTALSAGVLIDALICVPAFLSWRQTRREALHLGEDLLGALRQSLGVVEWQLRNGTLLCYGLGAALVVSLGSLLLQYSAHLLPLRGLVAGAAMALVFTGAVVGTLRRHQRRELRPRRAELRELIAALEA